MRIDSSNILHQNNFRTHAVDAAQMLLGKLLIRRGQVGIMGGFIIEAEAYEGEDDLGCHAKAGKTPRTSVMYGPPGHAYIYFTYGMHWMLNAVTGEIGHPGAVLIRGIHPMLGLAEMDKNRPRPNNWKASRPASGWTDGPAKLCQALSLTGTLNGTSLVDEAGVLVIVDIGLNIPAVHIKQSARIGLFTVPEPWKSIQWNWKADPSFHFPDLSHEEIQLGK